MAEYLLAEVLERQPEEVRRLLLRTSLLERVNGELADALTESSGGERVLQALEQANAFVVALDVRRSWFRYHHLFADLLQRELRRTAADQVTALHQVAAEWFGGHGFPVEAIRHAQAGQDWGLAVRLLGDHWPGLQLGGQAATVQAILAGFPADAAAADAELAALVAADELAQGSMEAAERYLRLAAQGSASVPAGRRMCVRTVFSDTDSSRAISRADKLVGRYRSTRISLWLSGSVSRGDASPRSPRVRGMPPPPTPGDAGVAPAHHPM